MAGGIQIGSTFAGYSVEGVLGRGGMGVVYLAEQPELGRKVAIKVIAPALASDPDYLRRFKHESRLAAAIEHPNAIPIYEAGVAEDDIPYLVMRYVDGVDLATLLRREGRLDGARAARIVEQVSGALDEAHARGLVHRDVKPANVIVEQRRGGEQAYLTDFGLTKQMDATSGVTGTGRWVGTIDYASPEQIKGKHVDARSDVYSLGCVMFVALTGRLPFEREAEVAKLYAHLSDPAPAPSSRAQGERVPATRRPARGAHA
jgi:serine/threonine protein kinase